MKKKIKTYVLIVSSSFPAYHPRVGNITYFSEKIRKGEKKHTIRLNYELWKKRIEEVQRGEAILSVREWIGKPYISMQRELFFYSDLSNIGVEKLERDDLGWYINGQDLGITTLDLAANDGLTKDDFTAWFKGKIKTNKPMAIIHFTEFRYGKQEK